MNSIPILEYTHNNQCKVNNCLYSSKYRLNYNSNHDDELIRIGIVLDYKIDQSRLNRNKRKISEEKYN